MPRNMSFQMTTDQYRNRTKTVTRRLGWWNLKPGEICNGVEKAQGLKKGEKMVVMGQHRIVSSQPEMLCTIDQNEVIREGFPGMTPKEFVAFFLEGHKCKNGALEMVNRIEFEYL